MPPRGYQRDLPRQELRLDCLQKLWRHHLRRKQASLQRVHPNRDTSPTKTRRQNESELVQCSFGHAVCNLN